MPEEIAVDEAAVDNAQIVADVIAHNPTLKVKWHSIEREEASRRLAVKRTRPSFVVGLDYIFTGDAIDPTIPDSGKDPFMASVGLSVPLWFGANKAQRVEAEARRREAEYTYADTQNRLRAVTEVVLFEYEDALRKTRLYRDGLVPKAEQSLNASYAAYQTGESDFLNVLDAQRQLLDFQLEYERARSNLAIRAAEIEMLIGREMTHDG